MAEFTQTNGYRKILVAVDYEDTTPEVFRKAIELAKTFSSELKIFHCLQKPLGTQPDSFVYKTLSGYSGLYSLEALEMEERLLKEMQEEFQNWLSTFVRPATAEGIKAHADYQVGEAGQQICRVAKDWGADLIVIGRRGRQGLSELLLGSVSNYILHHATCSVLIVQKEGIVN